MHTLPRVSLYFTDAQYKALEWLQKKQEPVALPLNYTMASNHLHKPPHPTTCADCKPRTQNNRKK